MADPNHPTDDDPIFAEPAPKRSAASPHAAGQSPGQQAGQGASGQPLPDQPDLASPRGAAPSDGMPSTEEAGDGRAARLKEKARPFFEQTWLNLRVWGPALANPHFRAQQVKYRSREHRVGLEWKVAMPKQCYHCGTTDAIQCRQFRRDVRAFDAPMAILLAVGGSAAFFVVIWLLSGSSWLFQLALILLVLGAALLWIKSWKEDVRLSMWGCQSHFDQMPTPGLVIHDDELYVLAPTSDLAQTARAELTAARRRLQKYPEAVAEGPLGADPPAARPSRPPVAPPPSAPAEPFIPPPRPDLPPIKLAGDDEEPPKA